MSEATLNAIKSLMSGDTSNFKQAIENALGQRAVDRINVERIKFADRVFKDDENIDS